MVVEKSSKKKKSKQKKKVTKVENVDIDLKEEIVSEEKIVKVENDDITEENVLEKVDETLEEKGDINDNLDNVSGNIDNKKASNMWKIILILAFLVILVLLLVIVFFPKIKLNGNEKMTITYNDVYKEPGYNVYVLNKKISKDIKVDNNIENGVVGIYEVNYYFDFFGIKIGRKRKVEIIDNISPKLETEIQEIQICPNEEIPDIKYEAIDEYDGDITSKVQKEVHDNEVLFKVMDNNNNFTSVSVKVNRGDEEKPIIKLKGSSVTFITYGNTYKEPGYTATDNCDGDITDKVVITGGVGRNIGSYQLKYEVEDENGNKTSVTRKVIVGTKVQDNGSVNKGTIYLTFDDGPNQGTTNKILDILKSEGVKATFFVTCKGPDNLIKRMYDEGHTVGLHTASHDYSYVYSSVDNYFNDLNKVRDRVKRITGIDSKIIRFPGGSSNTISKNYNRGIMTELSNIVLNDGYRYFDWNVDGMDASSARNSSDVYYNVTSNLSYDSANVVLLHDIKSITVYALEDIIEFGKKYGYKFSAIDMNTYMVRHKVNN